MWTYKHQIGVIHVENWGKPFIVVTEDSFWNGEHNGYNYYKLGVVFDSEEEAKKEAQSLNNYFGLPAIFDAQASQKLLLILDDRYPKAKIRKG